MATMPQPDPQQSAGSAPDAGGAPGGSPSPSQAPAPPELMLLAKITMALKQLAQQNPALSPGLQKAVQGINEAQSAMVSQPKPQSAQSSPPL